MTKKFANCAVCQRFGSYIESPTGSWWAHEIHPADGHDFAVDIHAFQGIVTKLRTTKGSPFALDVMAEAADEIELLHEALDLIRIIDDGWLLQTPPTHTQAREQMNEILSRIKALRERGAKVSA